MRTILFATIAMLLSGCVTPMYFSSKEQCAFEGLKLSGVVHSNHSGMATNFRGGAVGYGGNSESLACEPTKDPTELAEISKLQDASQPKLEYSSKRGWRNIVIATGYLFWILPGVGAKLYYDADYEQAMEKSRSLERTPATASKP